MDQRVIEISSITTSRRRAGVGGTILRTLCQIADEHRVTLEVEPGPRYDEDGEGEVLDGGELVAWYMRHGFEWADGYMLRKPRL